VKLVNIPYLGGISIAASSILSIPKHLSVAWSVVCLCVIFVPLFVPIAGFICYLASYLNDTMYCPGEGKIWESNLSQNTQLLL